MKLSNYQQQRRKLIMDTGKMATIANIPSAETIDNSLDSSTIEDDCSQQQTQHLIPLEQPSTQNEKREKVRELIKLNPSRSSRAIADDLGVSNSFVSKVKKLMVESEEIFPPDEVLDQKGRMMNVTRIKGKRKPLKEKIELLIKSYEPSQEEIKDLILMLQKQLF